MGHEGDRHTTERDELGARLDDLEQRLRSAGEKDVDPDERLVRVEAELRVRCINDKCWFPIPYLAKLCPFCKHPQPPVNPYDKDRDGMDDRWERKYGLNPMNRDDADQDPDRDGYTNLEEHGPVKDGSDSSNPRRSCIIAIP